MSYDVDLDTRSRGVFFDQGKLNVLTEREQYPSFVSAIRIIAENTRVEANLSIEELSVRIRRLQLNDAEGEEGALIACIDSHKKIYELCKTIENVCSNLLRKPRNIEKVHINDLYRLVDSSETEICQLKERIAEIWDRIHEYERGGKNGKLEIDKDTASSCKSPHENKLPKSLEDILDPSFDDAILSEFGVQGLSETGREAVLATYREDIVYDIINLIADDCSAETQSSLGRRTLNIAEIRSNIEHNITVAKRLLNHEISVNEARVRPVSSAEKTALKVDSVAKRVFSPMPF